MLTPDWVNEFPAQISVCDTQGVILAINEKEAEFFQDQGGKLLIGTNLANCHSHRSTNMIQKLMQSQEMRVYTVEEQGTKELIIQGPWYQDGQFSGLVEIAVKIPDQILHIIR
jgi:transcriptional regulator with PAS, ATPase and Fis domain